MKKFHTVTVQSVEVLEVLCDMCGSSCKVDEYVVENPLNQDYGKTCRSFEYLKMEATWGYHSRWDMDQWQAHVCMNCVETKLMPIVNFQVRERSVSHEPMSQWMSLSERDGLWAERRADQEAWENSPEGRAQKEADAARRREGLRRIRLLQAPVEQMTPEEKEEAADFHDGGNGET